jgi:hypothetical protein
VLKSIDMMLRGIAGSEYVEGKHAAWHRFSVPVFSRRFRLSLSILSIMIITAGDVTFGSLHANYPP